MIPQGLHPLFWENAFITMEVRLKYPKVHCNEMSFVPDRFGSEKSTGVLRKHFGDTAVERMWGMYTLSFIFHFPLRQWLFFLQCIGSTR
jgi:hypothetical protein